MMFLTILGQFFVNRYPVSSPTTWGESPSCRRNVSPRRRQVMPVTAR